MVAVEALACLVVVSALIRLFPFAWFMRWLIATDPGVADGGDKQVELICRAVARIAAWPRTWATCLPQALAAHRMLARRGIATRVRFGVRRDARGLHSHAWLMHGARCVLGESGVAAYALVAEYPRRAKENSQPEPAPIL